MLKKTSITRLMALSQRRPGSPAVSPSAPPDQHGQRRSRSPRRRARCARRRSPGSARRARSGRCRTGLRAGRGLDEVEVLLVGGLRREDPGEERHEHDEDGDDEAAENDRASEGPADAPAEARHLTWGIGSHEHGLACELQRRDARRARRGLSRPAPFDDEGNFSRGKWPGPGASRTMSGVPAPPPPRPRGGGAASRRRAVDRPAPASC